MLLLVPMVVLVSAIALLGERCRVRLALYFCLLSLSLGLINLESGSFACKCCLRCYSAGVCGQCFKSEIEVPLTKSTITVVQPTYLHTPPKFTLPSQKVHFLMASPPTIRYIQHVYLSNRHTPSSLEHENILPLLSSILTFLVAALVSILLSSGTAFWLLLIASASISAVEMIRYCIEEPKTPLTLLSTSSAPQSALQQSPLL